MQYAVLRCRCGENVGAHVPDALLGERVGASGPSVAAAAALDLSALKAMSTHDRICDKSGVIVCRKCGRGYDVAAQLIRGLGR